MMFVVGHKIKKSSWSSQMLIAELKHLVNSLEVEPSINFNLNRNVTFSLSEKFPSTWIFKLSVEIEKER